MATAQHAEAAPAPDTGGATAPRPGRGPRGPLPALATTVLVAVAVKLVFGPWYLNYDARYALLWARDISRGLTPDYQAAYAPTPHPLSTAWSVLALPFGESGDRVIVWLTLLAFGALVYLAYRLGAELFSPAVGVVTALVVLTRPALIRDTVLGYQDLPFACLVVGAVIAEARRPKRGTLVLVLLAIAGLLRPEAWVLAGLYWLYLFRERGWADRLRFAALVAVGPVAWLLMDLAVTGDALHSLHGTSALAETAGRRRHLDQVPYWTAQYFGYVLREPLLVAIPLGLWFAWRRRLRAALLPLGVAAAMVVVFAVNPVFGLPLIGRYVRTPSVLLAVFAGLAVCGWLLLRRDDPGRRAWQVVAAVAVLASVVYLPWHARLLQAQETRVDRNGELYAGLRDVAHSPRVRAAMRACGGRIAASDHRPVPYLRHWLGTDPGSVVTLEGGTGTARVLVTPRDGRIARFFYRTNFPSSFRAPPGYRTILRAPGWRVLADPACV